MQTQNLIIGFKNDKQISKLMDFLSTKLKFFRKEFTKEDYVAEKFFFNVIILDDTDRLNEIRKTHSKSFICVYNEKLFNSAVERYNGEKKKKN